MDLNQVETVVDSKSFIKMTPVINVDFLDKELVERCLEQAICPENGIDQEYVEWDTGWIFSASAVELSNHLVSRGAPKGKSFLLKMF